MTTVVTGTPSKRSFVLSLVLKLAIIACASVGIGLSFAGKDRFMTGNLLLYFTNQSNIWIAVVALAFVVLEIASRVRSENLIRNWMRVTKLVFTVSITLTFLVFAVLLAPLIGGDYLTSPSNLCLHFIVPLLSIADFLLFDYRVERKRFTFALATIPPLVYLFATIILMMNGVRYQNGDAAPYYFLNYEQLGWLSISDKGIGVVYWVLIMIALVCGIALGLCKLADLRRKAVDSKAR